MYLLIAMLLGSAPALAEDPKFEGVAKEDPPPEEEEEVKPETDLMVELGGAVQSGNSVFWAVNGRAFGGHKWSRNKLSFELGANTGASKVDVDGDGKLSEDERDQKFVETSRRYTGRARYDRFLADKDSLYFLVGSYSDKYAGMDLRAHAQLGYARHFIDTKPTKLHAEFGVDVAREDYVEGIDPNENYIVSARILGGFRHKLSENVAFIEQAEVFFPLPEQGMPYDLRLNNTASLSIKVSDALAIKASHTLIFDNAPVEGFQKADQTTMLTLSVTLF